jgi:hypothetical protein
MLTFEAQYTNKRSFHMATNLSALQAAIKLLADAVTDVASKGSVLTYLGLLPDLMGLVPQIGDIPAEVKSMQPQDYVTLAESLAQDLQIPSAKVQGIIQASLVMLNALVGSVLPAVEQLVAAIQSK